MSDVGRYRKLYTRLWLHLGFVALTDAEKIIAIYLLTGPQTNRVGLYTLSIALAAEHLRMTPKAFAARLVPVCAAFEWAFDEAARVLYIPSWFTWNPPDNSNVLKGGLKDLAQVPSCRLLEVFADDSANLPETLRRTLLEGLQERLPKQTRIQRTENREQVTEIREQGSASSEQEHVPARPRGANGSGKPPSTALTTTRRPHEGNGTGMRERFEAFWQVYPRQVGKDAAWRAWQKRKPSADLTAQIFTALAWQRQQHQWVKDGGQFVPNPATWINAGRWQDEPSTMPRVSDRTLAAAHATDDFLRSTEGDK